MYPSLYIYTHKKSHKHTELCFNYDKHRMTLVALYIRTYTYIPNKSIPKWFYPGIYIYIHIHPKVTTTLSCASTTINIQCPSLLCIRVYVGIDIYPTYTSQIYISQCIPTSHVSWWVLQHCTGFARLVWGRLSVHRAFVYSDWFVRYVCFGSLLPISQCIPKSHNDTSLCFHYDKHPMPLVTRWMHVYVNVYVNLLIATASVDVYV